MQWWFVEPLCLYIVLAIFYSSNMSSCFTSLLEVRVSIEMTLCLQARTTETPEHISRQIKDLRKQVAEISVEKVYQVMSTHNYTLSSSFDCCATKLLMLK